MGLRENRPLIALVRRWMRECKQKPAPSFILVEKKLSINLTIIILLMWDHSLKIDKLPISGFLLRG
jgi:hypothetical protein